MGAESPLLICNEEHRFLAAEQMRLIGREDASILLEPVGRNTAPAIALAALFATRNGDDPLLLVLAADHFILDVDRFCESVKKAVPMAEQGKLVTFGIVPDRNETGYGYILRGEALSDGGFVVGRFEEKPDRQTAEKYVKSGDYYWNSGMFMFRASRYLEELKRRRPEILDACSRSISVTEPDMQFVRVDAEAFEACPAESIDYAVMEKTDDAVVIPLDARWSDIGSWSALWDVQERDGDGNAFKGDVLSLSSNNNNVRADGRLVAIVGVKDLVVVETKDAVPLAPSGLMLLATKALQ
ncbi:mannose-1-phosphate guanylyltransferase/mannose-6-phosphate isomerase [Allomesorhizobium camelthorni]|uniref:mannose-1-phosphate guanylyltransferase/mannose-6-phosphate isomerase n=1 Tax=Allomesorhizobium camelthorni TaxID=475069 RepID=UPI003CCE1DFA